MAQILNPATIATTGVHMARLFNTRHHRQKRRGRSAGAEIASYAWRATEKGAEGLGRWMTTDHTGLSQRLSAMPDGMGFLDSLGYIVLHFLLSIVFAIVQAVWIVFVIWAFIWFITL